MLFGFYWQCKIIYMSEKQKKATSISGLYIFIFFSFSKLENRNSKAFLVSLDGEEKGPYRLNQLDISSIWSLHLSKRRSFRIGLLPLKPYLQLLGMRWKEAHLFVFHFCL